jgi:hypothetical protein
MNSKNLKLERQTFLNVKWLVTSLFVCYLFRCFQDWEVLIFAHAGTGRDPPKNNVKYLCFLKM